MHDIIRPSVVGSMASLSALKYALTPSGQEGCDFLELRLDALLEHEDRLLDSLKKLPKLPLILTVRSPDEGGFVKNLQANTRIALFSKYLAYASWVDIEFAHQKALSPVIQEAKKAGKGVIFSHHNFIETPSLPTMHAIAEQSKQADLLKFAFLHTEFSDCLPCLAFLKESPLPCAMMGMGILAAPSRILYAQKGSLLNYGYLGSTPTAQGQWPASLLARALQHSIT